MTSTLDSIPVLVPVPATSRTHTPQPSHVSEVASDDRFASLFSPPTPPASRNSGSSSTQPLIFSNPPINPDSSQVRPRIHARTASDADWGSFMTVPASQDPLAASKDDDFASPVAAPAGPTQADPSFEFFETFGETARQASEAKRRSVLNELLEHEDDPLYFLSSHATSSGPAQVQNSNPVLDFSLLDLDPIPSSSPPPSDSAPEPAPSLLDQTIGALFGSNSSQPADSSSANHDSFAQHVNFDQAFGTPTFSPSEYHSSDLLNEALSSSHDTVPSIAAKEIPQPLNNHARSTSFSARWMPSMRVKRENSLHSDPSSSPDIDTGPSSLTSTLSRTVAAALTVAPGPPSRKQNPFAPEVFQPTSGAPGYAGEHVSQTQRSKKGTTFEFQAGDTEDKRAVVLEGRKASTTPVLSPVMASMVRPALPVLPRLARSWELLYSLDEHGISLRTLYTRCSEPSRRTGPRPALLVVRDAEGGTFGAFISEGIHASPGSYYGGGECFLWRADDSGSSVHVYKWTGSNDYVALCENNSISFGGGDGHYGLFLDDVLQDGSSAPCPTFANEILCTGETPAGSSSKSLDFECVGVEVWAIGT